MPFVIVIAAGLLLLGGVFLNSLGRRTPAPVAPVDTETADCDALCNQVGTKAIERRNAEVVEANARTALATALAADAAATALAIAAWAVVGVLLAGIITALAAAVATIAAIALTAAALVTAGVVIGAGIDVSNAAATAQAARDAELAARSLFLSKCKNQEKINACFARTTG